MKRTLLAAVLSVFLAYGVYVVVTADDVHDGTPSLNLTYNSVDELAKQAPVVVRAVMGPVAGTWNLSRRNGDISLEHPDEVNPGTWVSFNVSRFVRGEGPSDIHVSLPGGTYRGVTAPLRYPLEQGKEYLLFLSPLRAEYRLSPHHYIIHGALAIEDVTARPVPNFFADGVPVISVADALEVVQQVPYSHSTP